MDTVKETKRVLQVGSQTTSADIWWKAKKAIADGMIGQMIESQGSYHRNRFEGEWNWPIDAAAGPDAKGDDLHRLEHVARARSSSWRRSAPTTPTASSASASIGTTRCGIASDLFYHVIAPLNICWDEPQFPVKVMATGGIYVFKFKDEREVPDTFHLLAEYAKGHSLVLSSSMANSTPHPRPDPRARRHHHDGGPRAVRAARPVHHREAAK